MEKVSIDRGFGPQEITYLLSRSAVRAVDIIRSVDQSSLSDADRDMILLNIFRNLIIAYSSINHRENYDLVTASSAASTFSARYLSKIASSLEDRDLYLTGSLALLASDSITETRTETLAGEMDGFLSDLSDERLVDELEYDKKTFQTKKVQTEHSRVWRTALRRVSERGAIEAALSKRAEFGFWNKWLDHKVNGVDFDPKFEAKVALIKKTVWENGPHSVSEEIARLEAEHHAENLLLPEDMFLNETTGKLFVVPKQHPNSKIYEDSLARVKEAIETYLPQHSNAISTSSFPVTLVSHALSTYAGNPYRVHQDFLIAADIIKREIDIGDIPAGDTGVEFLLSALDEAAGDIRSAIPEVQHAVAARAQLTFNEASEEEKQNFLRAAEMLETISSLDLASEIKEDAESIMEHSNKEVSQSAIYRLASRISKATKIVGDLGSDKKVAAIGSAIAAGAAAVLSSIFGF